MTHGQAELGCQNLAFAEVLYEAYLADPGAVSEDWRAYFAGLGGNGRPPAPVSPASGDGNDATLMQHRVDLLVRNFRVLGHGVAHTDPLGLAQPFRPELTPEYFGFTEADLGRTFPGESVMGVQGPITLGEIVRRLRNTYCRTIGVQFMHIGDLEVREWLQARMEGSENRIALTRDQQLRILTRLTDAVIFEEFIQKKFIGAKSFSLEGAESLIPLLELAIEKAGEHGLEEIVLGMAHRGRLNVLANIMEKSPRQIFREFADIDPELHLGRGDVKYHLGYHVLRSTPSGQDVHLALCFNPSHLEFVNPVALGRVRARQDRNDDNSRSKTMAVLIHGDAAFSGEGIVQETLNLSELAGYTTGGTLHVIVNNQIGFTAPPHKYRSTRYASDVAKMLQSPIFHVNGEDPEAVAQVVTLCMDFRRTFKRDAFIDMYCYRRRGHNESDEPSFTQPLMYKVIAERESVRDAYLSHLLKLGGITRAEADEIAARRHAHLEDELSVARDAEARPPSRLRGIWSEYRGGPDADVPEVDTGVAPTRMKRLLEATLAVPEGFHIHPKLARVLEPRRAMAAGEKPLDWAAAEALALATLATEGYRVRLSGQDSERGTFSQRHAVLTDYETGEAYCPLAHLAPDQAPVEIISSPVSEAGVLGFEYGFAVGTPDGLVLWEAQFGDFSNAAQVIIDQFIASAEDKWRSLNGIVLLLPHGFEGMGPEHSSARLERYLGLCAEDNIQVAVPTTPAQYFHLLRRQVHRSWRKPLAVMTPKSLLRHPKCVSPLASLASGRFERILPDPGVDPSGVQRVLMCTGKVYYDLAEARDKDGHHHVAIVRVEQLYPLQPAHLAEALAPYPPDTPVYWVQEEPENMGAWRRMRGKFGSRWLGTHPVTGIYRPASASTATGSASSHRLEQEAIITAAFSD